MKKPKDEFWMYYQMREASYKIYVKELKISLISLDITFSINKSREQKGQLRLGAIMDSIGIILGNLDNAPLRIKGIKLEHIYETNQDFSYILKSHYISTGKTQILRLLGALDIIGSPINLIGSIGTGVTEFFSKPMEGFVKGP